MKPIFLKGCYEHSYAATPGKGAHLGKKYLERWIKNDPKNCSYVLKMDIKKFFPSIPHDKLKITLARSIKDEKLLNIIFEIIDVTDNGIPLGFYTSQWLSNWYLKGLDRYIKEDLKAIYYMRFMDDMVILAPNKYKLYEIKNKIEKYLNKELGLKLKENWQIFKFVYIKKGKKYGRDIDFMGFRFFGRRTILRRSIMLKATRTARRIHRKERMTIYDVRRMLSYLGWIDHTDTYFMYLKWIKPFVNFQSLKQHISRHDKQIKEVIDGHSLLSA